MTRENSFKQAKGKQRWIISGTFHVPPWPSVVEVASPVAVRASLDIVASGVISEEFKVGCRDEVVVPVHHLQVPEVGGAVEALSGEVAAAHLCRRVRPRRPGVDDLTAELHHVGVASQVTEEVRRPVPDYEARAQLQPPVPVLWILDTVHICMVHWCHKNFTAGTLYWFAF